MFVIVARMAVMMVEDVKSYVRIMKIMVNYTIR